MISRHMILRCGNHYKINLEIVMALDADVVHPTYDAPERDLYELGERLQLFLYLIGNFIASL